MASSKPKKGFSMSLSKTKGPSSAAKGRPDGERAPNKSSAIGVGHQEGEAGRPKRDYVTGIGGGKVDTKEPVIERGPRVIALASNPWARSAAPAAAVTAGTEPSANNPSSTPGATNGGTSSAVVAASPSAGSSAAAGATAAAAAGGDKEPEKSLDQLAVEALARESRSAGSGGRPPDRDGLGLDSDRVIGMAARPGGNAATAPGGTALGGSGTAGRGKGGGLLEQNMIPGLADVEGEDAKFKHDLGHRAEDMNVRSMAYVDVPVSEFGAALLRGMGWQGPDGDGVSGSGEAGANLLKDVEPRHHRLGLGAQPKPPEEMKRPRKRKPGEKPRASDAERLKIWEQKVREEKAQEASRPRAGQLSVMDVVEIVQGGDGNSRPVNGEARRPRAMVLKTQGVPGLNKISVRMEDTGEKVLVDKSSATRVSEDELARRPFSGDKRAKTDAEGPAASGRNDSVKSYRGSEGDGGGRNGGDKRSRSRSRSVDRNSLAEEKEENRRGVKKQKRSKKDKKKERKSGGSVTTTPVATTTTTTGSSSSSKRERSGRSSPPPGSDEDRNAERRRRNPDDRSSNSDRGRNGGDHGDDASWSRKRPRETTGTGTENGGSKKLSNSGGGGGGGGGEKRSSEPTWLRGNIRVRVVHKSYAGGRAYLGKGIVVDVPRVGEATVRMDQGDRVLEGVKQRHLETVLPTRGGKVIVVQGREQGTTGKLLAKDKDKATALVQVYEDLRALTLSLDDVAEFTGMLDEDMENDGY